MKIKVLNRINTLKQEEIQELIKAALLARKKAYAPYSKYHVGAAVLTDSKEIYTGCNIENAAFSPTVCAERTAIFKAVSDGKKHFLAIAIVAGKEGEVITSAGAPCGVCRQVMAEFVNPSTFEIYLAKDENNYETYTLEELLPRSFGALDIT